MLLLMAVAIPGLVGLAATGGPLVEAALGPASNLGALVVGEVALGACYAVMVPVLLARGLVPEKDRDVLRPHAGFLPGAAVLHTVAATVGPALFLWTFFLLFDGRLLFAQLGAAWTALGAHVAVGVAAFSALGVLLAEAMRMVLRRPGRERRAERIRRFGALPFLISFPAFLWIPLLMSHLAPGLLARLGEAAGNVLYVPAQPSAASLAVSRLRLGTLAAGAGGLLVALALAQLLLARRLSMTLKQLALTGERGESARSYRAFPLPSRESGWRHLSLFWWKDVILPVTRRPKSYASLHGGLLAAIVTLGIALGHVARRQPGVAVVSLPAAIRGTDLMLGVTAALAMVTTLGSLGGEGRALALLRPVLGPARLFKVKWCVAATYVVGHVPFYALAVAGIGALTHSARAGFGSLIAAGLVSGLLFSFFGTALGFLMPDFRGRSPVLPGASRASQLVFGAGVISVVLASALARSLQPAGAAGLQGMLGSNAPAAVPFTVLSLGLRAWAVRRFDRLEPDG